MNPDGWGVRMLYQQKETKLSLTAGTWPQAGCGTGEWLACRDSDNPLSVYTLVNGVPGAKMKLPRNFEPTSGLNYGSLDGNTLVVSEAAAAQVVNGVTLLNAGEVSVLKRNGTQWTLLTRFAGTQANDYISVLSASDDCSLLVLSLGRMAATRLKLVRL